MKLKHITRLLFAGFVLGAASMARASHHNAPKPMTKNGIEFVSGGVGAKQEKAMRRMANDYSLQITLIRPDGRYLARVNVEVSKADGAELLSFESDGPMVFADLEPGQYVVEVAEDGRTMKRTVNVQADDNTSVVFQMPEAA